MGIMAKRMEPTGIIGSRILVIYRGYNVIVSSLTASHSNPEKDAQDICVRLLSVIVVGHFRFRTVHVRSDCRHSRS